MVLSIFFFLLVLALGDGRPREQKCCRDTGCFNDNSPFDHLPVPNCPEDLDVKYSLFTRNNRDAPDAVSINQTGANFDGHRRTIFIIHGWNTNGGAQWMKDMKDGFLQQGDFNVILVDWGKGAEDIYYPQPAADARSVGAQVAVVMTTFSQRRGASYGNMYCVGHSLGSHVCGHAGKRLQGKLGRITGLDPAGPLFENYDVRNRVDKEDANFVDILHCAAEGFLTISVGIDKPIGDVDFYPNNGRCQASCYDCFSAVDFEVSPQIPICSHSVCKDYFIEGLKSDCKFTAYPCGNKGDADNGACNDCKGNCQYMGFESETHPGRGTYYLKTNPSAPHCQG